MDVQTYEYTKGGELFAWLIKGLDPKQHQYANAQTYNLIVKTFDLNEDTSFVTISKFIRKCKDKGVFEMLIQHIRDVVHLDLGIKSVYHLFMYIFNSSFKGSQIQGDLVNMWAIEELSPEIRKLMVYQLKLNVERRFEDHQGSLSMEYEQLRFELRGEYEKIVLEGKCLNCNRQTSVGVHYYEYIKNIIDEKAIWAKCPHCGLKASIIFNL